jgi:hypothetical protein
MAVANMGTMASRGPRFTSASRIPRSTRELGCGTKRSASGRILEAEMVETVHVTSDARARSSTL